MSRFHLVNADWNFWPEGSPPPTIWAECADLGFEGLELGVYDPDIELSPVRVAEAATLSARHRIGARAALFSMPPSRWPGCGLASVEHRAEAVRAIVETGRRAAGIGATVLGVWPGADLPAGGPDDWARTAESLAAVADGTRSLGLTVAVEPKPGQLVAGTQDAIRLCEEIGDPGIGVLLDTAHALAAGEDIEALPERIGTRLLHVHLGDSDGGDADADLPPGSVHDFGPFLAALQDSGYQGALSFDLYGAVSAGGCTGREASRLGLAHVTAALAGGHA